MPIFEERVADPSESGPDWIDPPFDVKPVGFARDGRSGRLDGLRFRPPSRGFERRPVRRETTSGEIGPSLQFTVEANQRVTDEF